MRLQAASSVKTSKVKNNSTWSVKSKKWQNRLQDVVGYRARLINLAWLFCALSQGQRVIVPQRTCSRVGLYCSPIQANPKTSHSPSLKNALAPTDQKLGTHMEQVSSVIFGSCMEMSMRPGAILHLLFQPTAQREHKAELKSLGTLMFSKNIRTLVFNLTFLKNESNLGFEEAASSYHRLRFYPQMLVRVCTCAFHELRIKVHNRRSH